jgi:two-component system, response regulator
MERAILLVEDNEDDIDLTLRALNTSRLNNDVVVARDGREALDYLEASQQRSSMPIVVLLDLRLPKIDGLEVLRRIRSNERTQDLPVIIMTSSQDDEDRLHSELYGASSFMVKPGDYDQLMAAVKKLGLYWSLSKPPTPAHHESSRLGLACRYAGAAA